MSHVVLARKYRPRSFEEMVGQGHVVQALGNALRSGRLHHAYLFTGTRGIGKTTVSRILAKSLNCTGPDGTGGVTAQPCGVCQACTEIDADRYIDYIELDAASNRSIDEIRDLIERAAYKPSVGRYKVFMIDEAHQLTKDAFNALLKTLEEPPEYLKFVLATTDPDKMLPTVLSRCLQFNLRPMAPETVHEHLRTVLAAEGVAAEDPALRLLARAARGSMRDALSLTDQAIAFGAGQIDEAGVRAMLGAVDRHHAATLVRALARRDGPTLLATVDQLRQHGLSAAGTLEELAGLLQQMAVAQVVPDALDATDPDSSTAQALAAELPPDETQLLYSIALQGRAELSLNGDEYAGLTMVLLRLFAFPSAGAAVPAPASPRALPLQAAAREARAIAVPRPLAPAKLPPAKPLPAKPSPALQPPATRGSLAQPMAVDPEPPPWLDELNKADDGQADGATTRPSVKSQPSTAAETQPVLRTALGERWSQLMRPVAAAGSVTAMVRELAWQSELIAVEPGSDGNEIWRLQVERETLRAPMLRDKLQAALQAAQTQPLVLEVVAGTAHDTIARRELEARAAAQRQAEQTIQSDPTVVELMAHFRTARIVPGSIRPVADSA